MDDVDCTPFFPSSSTPLAEVVATEVVETKAVAIEVEATEVVEPIIREAYGDHDDEGLTLTAEGAGPCALVLQILFKTLALFIYVFMPLFNHGGNDSYYYYNKPFAYTPWALFVMLLLTMDFLLVKNVTGRQLVGLGWGFKVNYNPSTMSWNIRIETVSQDESTFSNPNNSCGRRVFWTSLIAAPIFWTLLSMLALIMLRMNWLMLCIVALSQTGVNAYGYYKADRNPDRRGAVQFQQMTIHLSDEHVVGIVDSDRGLGVQADLTILTNS